MVAIPQLVAAVAYRLSGSQCQIAFHYYFKYYTIYVIIILMNGEKCEVRKWKLN
jgi:hypothetical protein